MTRAWDPFLLYTTPLQSKNSPYRNPTASGYDSPLRLPEVDGGFRTVTSLGQEEVGKEEQSENYVMSTPPGEPQTTLSCDSGREYANPFA